MGSLANASGPTSWRYFGGSITPPKRETFSGITGSGSDITMSAVRSSTISTWLTDRSSMIVDPVSGAINRSIENFTAWASKGSPLWKVRSEERRVGKECRSRGGGHQQKEKGRGRQVHAGREQGQERDSDRGG